MERKLSHPFLWCLIMWTFCLHIIFFHEVLVLTNTLVVYVYFQVRVCSITHGGVNLLCYICNLKKRSNIDVFEWNSYIIHQIRKSIIDSDMVTHITISQVVTCIFYCLCRERLVIRVTIVISIRTLEVMETVSIGQCRKRRSNLCFFCVFIVFYIIK